MTQENRTQRAIVTRSKDYAAPLVGLLLVGIYALLAWQWIPLLTTRAAGLPDFHESMPYATPIREETPRLVEGKPENVTILTKETQSLARLRATLTWSR